jgi:hypothetical protein
MNEMTHRTIWAALFAFVLALTASNRHGLAAEVIILEAVPVPGQSEPFSSRAPPKFSVNVALDAAEDSILFLWVVEYPSADCSGPERGSDPGQTNGGADFRVPSGPSQRRFLIPWGGMKTGTYEHGTLRIGARLENTALLRRRSNRPTGEPIWGDYCFTFDAHSPRPPKRVRID